MWQLLAWLNPVVIPGLRAGTCAVLRGSLLIAKTANITKDDITSQHSDILAMYCEVISSFVIFAVLDLRDGGCRP